jgi:hypothetical protein
LLAKTFTPVLITVATFIRFDSADGNHRVDVVEERRNPKEYDKLRDFYLQLRHRIRKLAGERELKARDLLNFADEVDGDIKRDRFRRIAKGYGAFERRLRPRLIGTVPKQLWADAGIRVTVDPEIVFRIGQQRFITKLYVRKDELEAAARLISSLQMMRECYDRPGYRVAVLDCERGTLHRDTRLDPRRSGVLLRTTAAQFVGIWRLLDEGVQPYRIPDIS